MTWSELFRAEGLPVLQNRMFPTEAEALASPTGDVVLVQDLETGLIFNSAFDPEKLRYDTDYQNEQACSSVFRSHLAAVAEVIHRQFRGRSIIEVGCGKGFFLEQLQKDGFDIRGIDPAYEGDNPQVAKAPFEPGLGWSADGIILRHVLEHVPDPVGFLSEIARANGGRGAIYLEVPCFDWICRNRAWFDIFYEHVNYFRLVDFHRIFGSVREGGHLFGGQYLYVVADLSSLRRPSSGAGGAIGFPDDFLRGVRRASGIARGARRNVIWGAASKGVIFAVYMKRAGVTLDLAIDINPAKQERYMAGSGLRVAAPSRAMEIMQRGDTVFIMNSMYNDEIVAQSGNRYHCELLEHE